MNTTFLTSILSGGIDNPNFFNGRILTAQDLRDLQTSGLVRARRLGLAVGEGVAYGLFAEKETATSLRVSAGLALNRRGETLLLPDDAVLPVQAVAQAISPITDSPFEVCTSVPASTSSTPGYFLLAITSATQPSREQSPHSGLNSGYLVCTSRYETEGVQFKLIPLEGEFSPTGAQALHRSQLAQALFGISELRAFDDDPFSMPAYYGLMDELRSKGALLDCDVPLAALHWTGTELRFVDAWAARRALLHPAATAEFPLSVSGFEPFPQHASERRYIEAQAMLQQFQAQLAGIPDRPGASVEASFVFLPAAGYLPLGASQFSLSRFFPHNANQTRDLDPAFVRLLFQNSFFIESIPVRSGQAVEVDFFNVIGSEGSFIIFARREPVVVEPPEPEEPEEPEQPEEEPRPAADGTIVVTVSGPGGDVLLASDIEEVSVTSDKFHERGYKNGGLYAYEETGMYKVVTGSQVKNYANKAYMRARSRPYRKGQAEVGSTAREEARLEKIKAAVYVFKRPPGAYSVLVIPEKITGLQPNSEMVRLASDQVKHIEIELRERRVGFDPGKVEIAPDDPYVIDGGYVIDDIYINPIWEEVFREPLPVDPDEWWTDPPRSVIEKVEDVLSEIVVNDPSVVVGDPEILVNPDYSPDVVMDDPYAFVRTKDGHMFPVILAADKNAVKGQVSAERAGLPEVDAAARAGDLQEFGLAELNALGGAWGSLMAMTMGIGLAGAKSLTGEVVGQAREIKGSFARYAGVSAREDAALKNAGITDDVVLANSRAEDVLAALNAGGGTFTEGFALRLRERAREAVPRGTWALDALGLDEGQKGAVGALGIESIGEFTAAAGSDREALKTGLNVSDSALNNLTNTAQASLIAGKVREAGRVGVANVEGVTSDIAAGLIRAGVKTVSDLVKSDPAALAASVGVSEPEMREIVSNAGEQAGTLAILKAQFGLQDSEINQLRDEGVVTLHDAANKLDVLRNVVGADRTGAISGVAGTAINLRLRLGGIR